MRVARTHARTDGGHPHIDRPASLLEVVLGPALEADLAEGETDEQTQVPCHQPQPATTYNFDVRVSVSSSNAAAAAAWV